MPKVVSSSSSNGSGPQLHGAHILRRNQACHQCRRRKLKCDAKRPCSTCARSHSYAVAHAPEGAELPEHPVCTFDEVSDADSSDPFDNPKSRFERLENRINELEALLRDKDPASASAAPPQSQLAGLDNVAANNQMDQDFLAASLAGIASSSTFGGNVDMNPFQTGMIIDPTLDFQQFQSGSALGNLADVASFMSAPSMPPSTTHTSANSASPGTNDATPSSSIHSPDPGLGMLYNTWPKNLPEPTFLRHLVDAFFTYHPDANRLFHQSTFLSTLTLPPTHPRFPATSVLHAICAVGSMYTAAVPRPVNPSSPEFSPYDIFPDKYKASEGIPDSFSEIQAKYARVALDGAMDVTKELFQNVQALILLSWWYWCNAKWAEAFLTTSHALRYSLPCGLNVCPPFNTIAETLRPPSLLPLAKTVIEDETRRNAFWIGYAYERIHGTGNGWAMTLDDYDVSQLLPVRHDQFEQGLLVLPEERQWSHENDVLLVHSGNQVDGFILYIKSTILLSKVKNFNLRFRSRFFTGDPNVIFPVPPDVASETVDPRDSPAFRNLDQTLAVFKSSFPPHLRNPTRDKIDPHLFAATNAIPYAEMLMHEPHAVVGNNSCVSSCKILTAARTILDMLYSVCSTSYDLRLLGLFPMMCWFMSGRVLTRFMRAAIDIHNDELCTTLRNEIDYIQMSLFRVGDHVPMAHRYGNMLHDFIEQTCGEIYATTTMPLQSQPQLDFMTMTDAMPDGIIYGSSQVVPTM